MITKWFSSSQTKKTGAFLFLFLPIIGLLLCLAGCPGELLDRERFFAPQEKTTLPDQASPKDNASVDFGLPPSDNGTPKDTTSPLPAGCAPATIFKNSCGGQGCHQSPSPAGSLDLITPGAESRVRNAGTSTICGPKKLFDPAKPLEGVFWEKIGGKNTCGAPMPLGKKALTSAELDCLKAWLNLVVAKQ